MKYNHIHTQFSHSNTYTSTYQGSRGKQTLLPDFVYLMMDVGRTLDFYFCCRKVTIFHEQNKANYAQDYLRYKWAMLRYGKQIFLYITSVISCILIHLNIVPSRKWLGKYLQLQIPWYFQAAMNGGLGAKSQIKFPSWSSFCSTLSGVVISLMHEALFYAGVS